MNQNIEITAKLENEPGDIDRQILVKVRIMGSTLTISPEGYGDYDSAPGHGVPIILEIHEGQLMLQVWKNINRASVTLINMEGAREG